MGINFFLLLFIFCIFGIIINHSNIIVMIILIEIMFLSLMLIFLTFSYFTDSLLGELISLYIIAFAAVETAIGLSLVTILYKLKGSIAIKFLNVLKG